LGWSFGSKLGSGGFGSVYKAWDDGLEADDGIHAVKFLAESARENAEAVARFKREVKLMRGLDHPNIVEIVDADVDAEAPYFVMPRADTSLHELIEQGVNEDEVDRIFALILDAMAYAHANRTIHRDMKPLNVLMYGEVPRVSDFGLGKNLSSDSTTLTDTTAHVGTFIYMAPEQLADATTADERSDIYSIGKTLQQMVTRRLPLTQFMADVPRKYRYLIERCTEQEPSDRYQAVDAVREAFEQVVRGIERPEVPDEEVERLVAAWREELVDDRPILEELHALFERHVDDDEFFRAQFPGLPDPLLKDYATEIPRDFERMLRVFDEHVSGSLNFDYCDVVANFYVKVWRLIDDITLRKLLFTRLVQMGAWHNRFHVGSIIGGLVGSVEDQTEAMMVADVFRSNPSEKVFCDHYVDRERLPTVIAAALDEPPPPTDGPRF
jgi:serine/threonine protein kinase